MFIELAEYLRCPGDHEETYCVVTPDRMERRHILEGTVGCPTCRREFPIVDGVAMMAGPGEVLPTPTPAPPADVPDPLAVAALLDVTGPGGYVVLVGSAVALAAGLGGILEGVHFVGVNVPAGVETGDRLSQLRGASAIPVRSSMARGVVLGAECGRDVAVDAVRVVLRGLRVVWLEGRDLPDGLRSLARGQGMTVGEKT